MASRLGPDAGSRLAYVLSNGVFKSAAGLTATIYTDSAGTTLATIYTYDGTNTPGAAISGSQVTLDSNSMLPKFWFPSAGTDTLYAKIGSASPFPINADYDARLDAIEGNTTSALPLSGGTLTGPLILAANPTQNLGAATKQYVDAADTTLTNNVATNTANIATNTANIATNTTNITSNTSAIATKVSKTGDTMTGALVVNVMNGSGLPIGNSGLNPVNSLQVPSSYPSDDIAGGTDGTGRLNLYSYQRANTNHFGEVIRKFLMRRDAKAMAAWYGPTSGYDSTSRDPVNGTTWNPVVWTGAHFEANDHASLHMHWELEVPDATGALQGRLECLFGNQTTGTIGLDKTKLMTNLCDFVVRAHGTDHLGADQYQALRIQSTAGFEKSIEYATDTDGTTKRWKLRCTSDAETGGNNGANWDLARYSDGGTYQDSPILVQRVDGKVVIANNIGIAGKASVGNSTIQTAKMYVETDGTVTALQVTATADGTATTAIVAVTAATSAKRAYDFRVAGDTVSRIRMGTNSGSGMIEFGDGTNNDVNLYRNGVGQLKTDTSAIVGSKLTVGNTALQTAKLYAESDGTINVANLTATADGTTTTAVLAINVNTSAKRFTDFRVSTDTVARLRMGMNGSGNGLLEFGDGTTNDTNLYRAAANLLKTDTALSVGTTFRHLGTSLGFYNATAVTKQTVTGSKGANAALTSLMSALVALGLVTDTTT